MDDHSRWKETEEVYSLLLTRGEDPEWRTSLESLHFQNLYLKKGFSLSLKEINDIRKSTVVRMLNCLVKEGVNFLSFYYHASSTFGILIYALFDAGSMPYLNQQRNPAVPEQKESPDTFSQSSGPSVFASATPTFGVFPITPNSSVATPAIPGVVPQPTAEASAKRAGTQASEYPSKNQKGGSAWRGGRRRRG